MKKRNLHIFIANICLIFFLLGQLAVYSHHHREVANVNTHAAKQAGTNKSTKDNCSLCDAMHHMHMLIFQYAFDFKLPLNAILNYTIHYDYQGVALILSAGRSPPCNC